MTFFKLRILAIALVVGCVAPPVASVVHAQTYQCADSTNDRAYSLKTYLVEVVTGTDTASASSRAQYNLPQVTPPFVSYVSLPGKCRTAALSYYRALGRPAPTSGTVVVAVVKVTTNRFVVTIEGVQAGEFGVTVVFDNDWHTLAIVAG